MNIFAIESSCDETACAIISSKGTIHENIFSQIKKHQEFNGVVPEIAAREHLKCLQAISKKTLKDANLKLKDIDAFAVTYGPGLIGGLISGVVFVKALASFYSKKLFAVNHLEGHLLSTTITDQSLKFPFLVLLASGGHCQFVIAYSIEKYEKIGGTFDDSAGEAFDKVAKSLGLEYPGGPAVEKAAKLGNENSHKFSLPLSSKEYRDGCDFSFSGIKTEFIRLVNKTKKQNDGQSIPQNTISDICASFQKTVALIFNQKLKNAIKIYQDRGCKNKQFCLVGGVASNLYIRESATKACAQSGFSMHVPPLKYCTDNATMIAQVAKLKIQNNKEGNDLKFEPKNKLPL